MKLKFAALAVLPILFVCGCSDSTQPAEKKAVAPPEPIKGRPALYSMYNMARAWAPDVQVLQLHSIDLPDVKRERGKAAAWEATFVSQQLGHKRSYTYSVVEAEGNLHKGVFAGLEEGWSGARTATPFLIAALKTDSDEVYQTAPSESSGLREEESGQADRLPVGENRTVSGPGVARDLGRECGHQQLFRFCRRVNRQISADDEVRRT